MVQCQLLRSESYISITRSSLQTRSLPRCLISSPLFHPISESVIYVLPLSALRRKKPDEKYRLKYLPVDVLGRPQPTLDGGFLSSSNYKSNGRSSRKFQCSEEISRSTNSWHMNNNCIYLDYFWTDDCFCVSHMTSDDNIAYGRVHGNKALTLTNNIVNNTTDMYQN